LILLYYTYVKYTNYIFTVQFVKNNTLKVAVLTLSKYDEIFLIFQLDFDL